MSHWHIAPTTPACTVEVPLVSGPSAIPDNQMTASSIYNGQHEAFYARLNSILGGGAWCPTYAERDAIPPNMYTQVSTYSCVVPGLFYFSGA